MNLREFLMSSMTFTGAAALAGSSAVSWADTAKRPLGVQLYTVRDQAEKDLPSVLAAIRNIGYEEVETYWNVYTHPAPELKRMVNDHGLHVPSGHFNYDGLEGKFDYAAELGLEYMICPMLPEKGWLELDTYKKAAEQFNKWGEQARKRGMHFGFHNHNYEFHRFPDKAGKTTTGYDVLMSNTDPNLVCAEKDDIRHMFVEQDSGGIPLETIATSFKNVEAIL